MKFFKSRAGAVVVLIVIILLSTAFSVHRSLGAACREISDGFYVGVYDEKQDYDRPSIDSQLLVRIDAAQGLLSLAESRSELAETAEALRQARYALLNAEDIHEKFDANHALTLSFAALSEPLRSAGLAERELSALQDYQYRFAGAQDTIDKSGYNDSVREFERSTLKVFPTNLLSALVASDIPQKFE